MTLDPNLKKISNNYISYYDFDGAFSNASESIWVLAQSKQFLEFNMRRRFTNKYVNTNCIIFKFLKSIEFLTYRFGETSMHIMKECFNTFNVAFTVPLNSIYKDRLDTKMSGLIEAGLTRKYFSDEIDKEHKISKAKIIQVAATPLSVLHLQGPFLLVPILLGLSFFVFCLEFCIGKNRL